MPSGNQAAMLSPTRRPKAAPADPQTETEAGDQTNSSPPTTSGLKIVFSCLRTGPSSSVSQSLDLRQKLSTLTYDEHRHEGSAGHWYGGGQGGHPELEKKRGNKNGPENKEL